MSDKIHVVMAADAGYVKGLEVAKASMIASCSEPSRLEFHLFGDDPVLERRIRSDFGTYKGSPMAFMRLYLGELLPDADWVVYSDVDTIWRRDVTELWNLREEAKILQWVQDIPSTRIEASCWQTSINPHFNSRNYGCSGVMLLNLKRMRLSRLLDKAISFTRDHGLFKYVDQDILNSLCHADCGFVPGCWNVLIPTPENCRGGYVLHLVGVGRCFNAPYGGDILQYHYWEHVAKGMPFSRPWALPFYLRDWMIRLCLPFSGALLRDRILRYFAFRWFFRKYYSN